MSTFYDIQGNKIEVGGGMTAEQIPTVDELFRIGAYTSDASAPYAAFRAAFGLSGSGDTGEDEPPIGDWETLCIIRSDCITYGANSYGTLGMQRASYTRMDIPVELNYAYKIEVSYTGTELLSGAATVFDKNLTSPNVGGVLLSQWVDLDESCTYEITVTEDKVTDPALVGWLGMSFRVTATDTCPAKGSIQQITIYRKAVA
jgi:hypothetical protein